LKAQKSKEKRDESGEELLSQCMLVDVKLT